MGKASVTDRVLATLAARKATRVNRDELVRFFSDRRGFSRLPAYGSEALSPEGKARGDVTGWVVPASCLGRTGRGADVSVRNSLYAWVRDRLLPVLEECGGPTVALSDVALHLEGTGDQAVIVVYRKA